MITITVYIESPPKNPKWTKIKFNAPARDKCTTAEIKAARDLCELIRQYAFSRGADETKEI